MKFTECSFDKEIFKGIEDAGFTDLMPVQKETFPHSLKGRDVLVQSQTGTGKTATFLLTIFQHYNNGNSGRNKKALIVTPTRELAIQIEKEAILLGSHLDLKIGCFYGGVGYFHQEKLIQQGVDIIIGTPGRLLDFNYQDKLSFKNLGFLVIDEADRMFDMGFLPDLQKIMRRSSSPSDRQTMLFSATLDDKTKGLARNFMNDPASVRIRPEEVAVKQISQVMYHVGSREKPNLLLGILKKETPKNVLIFTNMKRVAERVARQLQINGFHCEHISGDLAQSKRMRVLEQFKTGKLPILVATDVAARGLHIDDLEMIINYDLPGDCENYVHRIGRTARAGKTGKAITLACEMYIQNLDAIEDFLSEKIPVEYAEDDMFPEIKKIPRPKYPSNDKDKRNKWNGDRKKSSSWKKADSYQKKGKNQNHRKHKKSRLPQPQA